MASDWDALDLGKYRNEPEAVAALLVCSPLDGRQRSDIVHEAALLVEATRSHSTRKGVVQSFLAEFSLATHEGLVLMCLAEALLRTPDAATRDRLIAEKIGSADWAGHYGQSDSLFVNASTWGLMLTGRIIDIAEEPRGEMTEGLRRITRRIGEPVVRQALMAAIRIMGEQFVLGRTIDAALLRSKQEGLLCSFDMLGEGARTTADAERYERVYAEAIERVGGATQGVGPESGHGISVKLSALSPRYEAVQEARVWDELYPRVLRLAMLARRLDLNFTLDAEESDRLVISLKLFERLVIAPPLQGWQGLGIVVQAYQKRALAVIKQLRSLSIGNGSRIMVRLVKGAYWDSEIKRAQIAGRPDYPVFTTKAATDLSYLVCARALIDAAPALYPQFATHNAHTLVAVHAMAKTAGVRIEYQRLHGMGEDLYAVAEKVYGVLPVRAYAPVGGHEELLPYLVRRLLENGANTSFVHALQDATVPAHDLVADPIAKVEGHPDRHPRIPVPARLYGANRINPCGRDYSIVATREVAARYRAVPDRDFQETSSAAQIDTAVALARHAQPRWNALGGRGRAGTLRAMGDQLEREMDDLVALLSREAGKTLNDGVAEVREAIDFCRYYASLAEQQFSEPVPLAGPAGETNELSMQGRGVFVCISPWNFPLAIFTGQIAAALAAGNAVVAKPAEQTPRVAAFAVSLFRRAGLDPDLLALLPGEGSRIGPQLTAHPGIDGVAFTGGTETAWQINRTLAARPGPIIPFIAETGGINAMFVDTTALREQVVDDAILSAFGSAGQRCSALRILFLPEETADALMKSLIGAAQTLVVGDPADPATDVGPVIDEHAKAKLDAHIGRLEREAKVLFRCTLGKPTDQRHYFAPTIAEIPSPDFLSSEVFGPVLHVFRYRRHELAGAARALAARGYGLTLGIHSRVDSFAQEIRSLVPAGNCYVNRSMIGAVVGVQPFGGEGLSGTGPKSGGPHALLRYATERALSVNIAAHGGDPALMSL